MSIQHKQLAGGRWNELTFFEQMANIGSEVERTIKWKEKEKSPLPPFIKEENNEGPPSPVYQGGEISYSQQAFERALELLSLTINDQKNKKRLKELVRDYEVLVDYFAGENIYGSSDKLWQNYFFAFNWAARKEK